MRRTNGQSTVGRQDTISNLSKQKTLYNERLNDWQPHRQRKCGTHPKTTKESSNRTTSHVDLVLLAAKRNRAFSSMSLLLSVAKSRVKAHESHSNLRSPPKDREPYMSRLRRRQS